MQKVQQKTKPAALPKIASDAISKQPQRKAVSLPKKLVLSKNVKPVNPDKVLPQVKNKLGDDDKENRIPESVADKQKKGKHSRTLNLRLRGVSVPNTVAPKTNAEDDEKPVVIAPTGKYPSFQLRE